MLLALTVDTFYTHLPEINTMFASADPKYEKAVVSSGTLQVLMLRLVHSRQRLLLYESLAVTFGSDSKQQHGTVDYCTSVIYRNTSDDGQWVCTK